ncbi:MAG TPA: peptidoglycan DD-metalloendopeptidase family protein [Ignavibacteria bacterium]|nr:peptidoglycan DD-metalloendopeptidase family protein [Ignavibacteria bacterium]
MELKFTKYCILFLVIPFVQSYGQYDFIADKNKQIENYKKDIISLDEIKKTNENNIQAYKKDIIKINEELAYLVKFMDLVDQSKSEEIQTAMTEIELQELKNKLEIQKNSLAKKVVNMYKAGKFYEDQMIYASSSLNEVKQKLTYLNKFSESRKKDYDKVRDLYNLLEEKKKLSTLRSREKIMYIRDKQDDQRTLSEKKVLLESNISELEDENNIIEINKTRILKLIYKVSQSISERIVNPTFNIYQIVDYRGIPIPELLGRLIFPVQSPNIIEDFGIKINPETNTLTINNGIDVSIAEGSDVKNIYDGRVADIYYVPSLGNIVIVDHGYGFSSVYSNVKDIKVVTGDALNAGQIFAKTSQNFRGQCFHFELWNNKIPMDPKIWLRIN